MTVAYALLSMLLDVGGMPIEDVTAGTGRAALGGSEAALVTE